MTDGRFPMESCKKDDKIRLIWFGPQSIPHICQWWVGIGDPPYTGGWWTVDPRTGALRHPSGYMGEPREWAPIP